VADNTANLARSVDYCVNDPDSQDTLDCLRNGPLETLMDNFLLEKRDCLSASNLLVGACCTMVLWRRLLVSANEVGSVEDWSEGTEALWGISREAENIESTDASWSSARCAVVPD